MISLPRIVFIFTVVLVIGSLSFGCNPPKNIKDCPEGAVYKKCGRTCTKDCIHNPPICQYLCVPKAACFCPDDKIEHDGKCIDPEECPKTECTGGMVPTRCASMCPLTCKTPPSVTIACPLACDLSKTCECPFGLLEHNGECIKESDCPNV